MTLDKEFLYNLKDLESKKDCEIAYKGYKRYLDSELKEYQSLIDGKYTDANCKFSIMKRALNEHNENIIYLMNSIRKLRDKWKKFQ